MIPGSANPLLLASAAAAGGYQVSRSLRFNSADSANLSRTPGTASNRKTWTWAAWVKRSAISFSAEQHIWGVTGTTDDTYGEMYFGTGDTLRFGAGYNTVAGITTTRVFRDPGAWFHLVLAFDATQATAANKIRLYVNGVEETAFSSDTRSSLANQDWGYNNNVAHYIGRNPNSNIRQFNGYLAETYFIDGQQLTPSSFTEVSATTGQLIPIAYTGTFGTNGFWLKFSDNSAATAAALGNDYSGNNNDWTPNNLSVTAGAGNDSLVDTPTSYGTDTGVGGEVRGNYCIVNAVLPYTNVTLSNGNLDFVSGATYRNAVGTIGVSFGKWYWEVLVNTWSSDAGIGITNNPANVIVGFLGSNSSGWAYSPYPIGGNGSKYGNGAFVAYGATYTSGDIIGVVLDADNGTLTFYKNGVSQGTAFTGLAANTYFPAFGGGSSTSMVANFGQRAFAYQTPGTNRPAATFLALCDTNLGAPLTAKPNTLMDVALYTGNGSTQSITGLAFSPDLVWIKARSTSSYNHFLFDVIRGVNNELNSNTTDFEYTRPAPGSLTAFNSDGFALNTAIGVNAGSTTYVGWAWDAGTSTVSNTAGSITSQVRANPTAGFSVVTYSTGASSGNQTIGHGLNVTPSLIIHKVYSTTSNWWVYHASTTDTVSKYIQLNSTNATADNGLSMWGAALPTSTVFGANVGQLLQTNQSAVAYCFAPVVGYSSMGSYVGNGSADGPFCFTGFRPRFLLLKASSSTSHWHMMDTSREPYNQMDTNLFANLSNAELTDPDFRIDFLSNGFKLRTSGPSMNGSGVTYIYAAFAESPFQYARAR